MPLYNHVCEVCQKTEVLTPKEGFEKGWDYPPQMGVFGIISPRTCGDCTVDQTLWWKLQAGEGKLPELTEKEQATLTRILNEPSSIRLTN